MVGQIVSFKKEDLEKLILESSYAVVVRSSGSTSFCKKDKNSLVNYLTEKDSFWIQEDLEFLEKTDQLNDAKFLDRFNEDFWRYKGLTNYIDVCRKILDY